MRPRRWWTRLATAVLPVVLAAGCAPGASPADPGPGAAGPGGGPAGPGAARGPGRAGAAEAAIKAAVARGLPSPPLTVLGTLPHDPTAWTQGLELADGVLYEGTGTVGHSQLRELDPATGTVRRTADLPPPLYGEGITVVGPVVWQLTWRDGVALHWDRATLSPVGRVPWAGEGWGLCRSPDGPLLASDGTDQLRVLDPGTLAERGRVAVRVGGRPLPRLNELECGPGVVWANVFETDWLVRIDPSTGEVTAAVDASGLLSPDQQDEASVLNGIAAVPGTDELLLTGKYWPTLFRVRIG
jgi:glutaminyl-peptide cyclotransferase